MADKDKLEVRISIIKSDSKMRGYASITTEIPVIGKFAFHGIKIVEGSKGMFVSMPAQKKERDGKEAYYDHFHPITKEGREAISELILEEYEKKLASM